MAAGPGVAHLRVRCPENRERPEQLDELERLLQLCEVQAVRSGAPLPLGAHMRGNGVNFAIFSRHATGVRLDLFDRAEDTAPVRSIILDATRNKTGDIWHVWLEGIRPGQLYGFRIAGPYAPHDGHRFNPNKLVLDPCATAVCSVAGSRFATRRRLRPIIASEGLVVLRRRQRGLRAQVRHPARGLRLARRSTAPTAVDLDRDLRAARARIHRRPERRRAVSGNLSRAD